MTHPMLEKVARAIAEGLGDEFDNAFETKEEWIAERGEKGGRYRDPNEPRKADYLDAARAAVQALLEPDEGMVEAGKHVPCEAEAPGGVVYSTGGEATAIYRAMLLPLIEGEGE